MQFKSGRIFPSGSIRIIKYFRYLHNRSAGFIFQSGPGFAVDNWQLGFKHRLYFRRIITAVQLDCRAGFRPFGFNSTSRTQINILGLPLDYRRRSGNRTRTGTGTGLGLGLGTKLELGLVVTELGLGTKLAFAVKHWLSSLFCLIHKPTTLKPNITKPAIIPTLNRSINFAIILSWIRSNMFWWCSPIFG